jgi:hypothetical protein
MAVTPPTPTSAPRSPGRIGHGHWWRLGLPVLTLVSILVGTLLAREAVQAISASNDGDFSQNATDPSQPGWEARLEPTPAMLVIATDSNDQLSMVAVLARPTLDSGGEVVLIPPETLVGERTIAAIYRADGPEAAGDAVETLTAVDLEPRQIIASDAWPALVEPVAPLTVELADPLVRTGSDESTAESLLSAGEVDLGVDQIDLMVSHVNPAASPLERQRRQREFWEQWLIAIGASSDPNVVPGEAEGSGLGAFVRSIAGGLNNVVELDVLPGEATTDPLVAGAGAAGQIAAAVPFPRSPAPGVRPRTRVLDGGAVGQEELSELAKVLGAAGAEISVIGNANRFDIATSAVVYHDEAFADVVDALAQVLPGAEIRFEPIEDAALDVTVIWGVTPDALATPTPADEAEAG